MAKREGVEISTVTAEEHWLICPACSVETAHLIVASARRSGLVEDWLYYTEEYQIVQCKGCGELSFRKNETNSDDCYVDGETGETVEEEHVELYPPRLEGRKRLNDQSIPHGVRTIYRETFQALCTGQLVLAGMGVRALVEAVCREKGANGNDLYNRIKALVALGALTPEGANILHSLRVLGNKAAHEVEASSPYKLGLALDVVENLLNNVYIIPAKGRTLQESE